MATESGPTSDANGDWKTWVLKQGFTAALASAILWFVAYKMVLPMQEAHVKLVNDVSSTNTINAQTNRENAETNKQNAATLTKQTAILEEWRGSHQAGK